MSKQNLLLSMSILFLCAMMTGCNDDTPEQEEAFSNTTIATTSTNPTPTPEATEEQTPTQTPIDIEPAQTDEVAELVGIEATTPAEVTPTRDWRPPSDRHGLSYDQSTWYTLESDEGSLSRLQIMSPSPTEESTGGTYALFIDIRLAKITTVLSAEIQPLTEDSQGQIVFLGNTINWNTQITDEEGVKILYNNGHPIPINDLTFTITLRGNYEKPIDEIPQDVQDQANSIIESFAIGLAEAISSQETTQTTSSASTNSQAQRPTERYGLTYDLNSWYLVETIEGFRFTDPSQSAVTQRKYALTINVQPASGLNNSPLNFSDAVPGTPESVLFMGTSISRSIYTDNQTGYTVLYNNGEPIIINEAAFTITLSGNLDNPVDEIPHAIQDQADFIIESFTMEVKEVKNAQDDITANPLQNVLTQITEAFKTGPPDKNLPVTEAFFHGIYGKSIYEVNTNDIVWDTEWDIKRTYGGDQYNIKRPNIIANTSEPLPDTVDYEEALSQSRTNATIDAIIYSTGWGVDEQGEALLYFTHKGEDWLWIGVLFSFDGFQEPEEFETIPPPAVVEEMLAQQSERDNLYDNLYQSMQESGIEYRSLSINPSMTIAIHTSHTDIQNFAGNNTYTIIDLNSGTQDEHQLELDQAHISFSDIWLDEQEVIVQVSRPAFNGAPGSAIARLNVITQEFEIIERYPTQPPLFITADGTLVYKGFETTHNIRLWQDDVTTVINVDPAMSSPALSTDQNYLIGVHQGKLSSQADQTYTYQLTDLQTNEVTKLVSYVPPAIGGHHTSAVWNGTSTWAAVEPWHIYAEHSGVTLINTLAKNVISMGIETSQPQWASPSLLVFNAWVNGEIEQHLFDTETQTRYRLGEAESTASP